MERAVSFAFDEQLGWLSSCPTNLGTSMRASVHIKLPNLAKDQKKLEVILQFFLEEIVK
jgi:protein-arginine kinase